MEEEIRKVGRKEKLGEVHMEGMKEGWGKRKTMTLTMTMKRFDQKKILRNSWRLTSKKEWKRREDKGVTKKEKRGREKEKMIWGKKRTRKKGVENESRK